MEHAQYEPRRDDVGLQGNPHEASAKGLVPSVASPDIRHPLHLLRQEIEESVVPLRFQPEDAEPGERQPLEPSPRNHRRSGQFERPRRGDRDRRFNSWIRPLCCD